MKQLFLSVVVPLAATLSLVVTDVQAAVTCNKCISLRDQRCTSTLTNEPPTCTGGTCFTFTGTFSGQFAIIRDCIPISVREMCLPVNTQRSGSTVRGTYCYCSTDYCNGGAYMRVAPVPFNPHFSRTTAVARPVYAFPPVTPTVKAITALAVTNAAPAVQKTLTCNKCHSMVDQRCGSTITYTPPTCTGAACATFTGTASGLNAVVRDCIPSLTPGVKNGDCIPLNTQYAGVTIDGNFCVCMSDHCNGGTSQPVAAATFNQYSSRDTSFSNKGWKNAATATCDRGWPLIFVFTFAIWFTV